MKLKQQENIKAIHSEEGQILVEVLIALTVIFLSITASYLVVVVSNEMILDKKYTDKALFYANEGIGAVKSIRDRNWFEVVVGTHGLSFDGADWSFSGTQEIIESLTRQVVITDVATRTKRVDVSVTWTGFPSVDREVVATTHLSNWTVEDIIYDKWLDPSTLSSDSLVPAGNQGQDLDVENGYVYLASNHSEATSSDFWVFDVSDPSNPNVVADMDTGLSLKRLHIKEGDTYVYAVSENDADGFKVIDISTPTNPASTTTLNLPGTAANIQIFAKDDYAYVGTEIDAGDEEFIIVDISNPVAPSVAGSFEVDANVNGIFVYDDRAYLATSKDDKELIVVDVSNPSAPSELGYFDIADTPDAFAVYVEAPARVFVGRGRNNAGDEYFILDASDPASISELSSLEVGDDINDIVNVEWLSFLGTSVNNGELNIVNIDDLNNPVLHADFNYPQEALGVDYQNEYVYVATRSNDALRIVQGE